MLSSGSRRWRRRRACRHARSAAADTGAGELEWAPASRCDRSNSACERTGRSRTRARRPACRSPTRRSCRRRSRSDHLLQHRHRRAESLRRSGSNGTAHSVAAGDVRQVAAGTYTALLAPSAGRWTFRSGGRRSPSSPRQGRRPGEDRCTERRGRRAALPARVVELVAGRVGRGQQRRRSAIGRYALQARDGLLVANTIVLSANQAAPRRIRIVRAIVMAGPPAIGTFLRDTESFAEADPLPIGRDERVPEQRYRSRSPPARAGPASGRRSAGRRRRRRRRASRRA